jgi:hypothetical protein
MQWPKVLWPLYWLSFDLRLLITLLVSSHFWLLYWLSFDSQLLITLLVSSHFSPLIKGQSIQWPQDTNRVIRRCESKDSQYSDQKCEDNLQLLITLLVSSHFWPLYCLSFDLQHLITLLESSNFWPLYCLSFDSQLLIALLVSTMATRYQ